MLRNDTCNRGFHNWKAYPHLRHLYGGLPSNIRCPFLLVCAYKAVCYIYRYARVWFVYTHTFRQTLPICHQQHFQENHQPFYTSLKHREACIIALVWRKLSYILSGRIGYAHSVENSQKGWYRARHPHGAKWLHPRCMGLVRTWLVGDYLDGDRNFGFLSIRNSHYGVNEQREPETP